MKYTIRKIEYVIGEARTVCRQKVETENIEDVRRELRRLVKCDAIHFTYDTNEKYSA